jgi:hypothetical protein
MMKINYKVRLNILILKEKIKDCSLFFFSMNKIITVRQTMLKDAPVLWSISDNREFDEVMSIKLWNEFSKEEDRINVLNFEVSEDNRPRALRILDTIIKALRLRNHDIIADHFSTYAKIGDEHVKFRLREKQRVSETKDKWGGRIYERTSELVFVIDIGYYRRKEIKDGRETIEKKVSEIIAVLELEGKRMKEERIASEIRRKQWEEQQRIERELRDRQEKEAKAFKKLFLQAVRLHQATIIRSYIQTVESDAMEKGSITEEFIQWLAWAEQKVLWYDPLVNGPDPLLNDDHKTHLFKLFLKEWQ